MPRLTDNDFEINATLALASTSHREVILAEARRARSKEAHLTEEMARKDVQIQVLANALEKYSVRILVIGEGNQLPDEVAKLLRELGRLP